MYHSHMLQAAKKISNLNEFVYLANEISRMLKEEVGSGTSVEVVLGCSCKASFRFRCIRVALSPPSPWKINASKVITLSFHPCA